MKRFFVLKNKAETTKQELSTRGGSSQVFTGIKKVRYSLIEFFISSSLCSFSWLEMGERRRLFQRRKWFNFSIHLLCYIFHCFLRIKCRDVPNDSSHQPTSRKSWILQLPVYIHVVLRTSQFTLRYRSAWGSSRVKYWHSFPPKLLVHIMVLLVKIEVGKMENYIWVCNVYR